MSGLSIHLLRIRKFLLELVLFLIERAHGDSNHFTGGSHSTKVASPNDLTASRPRDNSLTHPYSQSVIEHNIQNLRTNRRGYAIKIIAQEDRVHISSLLEDF